MTIIMNTVKIGDRVILDSSSRTRGLDPDKVYTISGVHPFDGDRTAGTVSIMGEFNEENAKSHWVPGSYGYRIFRPAPERIALKDATDEEIVAELRLRGIRGTLKVPVASTETVHV